MTTRIRRIVVAVGDELRTPSNALRKAAALARASGASIELFHAMIEPDPAAAYPETLTAQTVRVQRTALAGRHLRRLARLARHPSLRGVRVACKVVWDHPPHEAVIRRALRTRTDLVIATAGDHRLGARIVLRNTDWELIRHCPVPVLLAKSRRVWHKPVVLAAVDPFHAHARPADLDSRLLSAGEQYAQLLKGQLHVFHAFMPLISVEPVPFSGAAMTMLPPGVQEAHSQQVERTVKKLAATARVRPGHCHISMGEVADELQGLTRKIRTGLVVMGAVSRSALKRFFIGNTAERVLDKLDCDVLVVKPRGFKSAVRSRSARPRSAFASTTRGARRAVVSTPAVIPPMY